MLQHGRLAPVQPGSGSGVQATAGDGSDGAATADQRLAHLAADETTAAKHHNPTTRRCRRGAEGYERKDAHDSRDEHWRRARVEAACWRFWIIMQAGAGPLAKLIYNREERSVPPSKHRADPAMPALTEMIRWARRRELRSRCLFGCAPVSRCMGCRSVSHAKRDSPDWSTHLRDRI